MRLYLADEYSAHHPSPPSAPLRLSEWIDWAPRDVPRQDNGSDCGVFTLKFADFLSHDPHTTALLQPAAHAQREEEEDEDAAAAAVHHPPSPPLRFTATHMPYFRRRIALEIKNKRVI